MDGAHQLIDPTSENGWSSWFCRNCRQTCASDNPCDCCDTPDED